MIRWITERLGTSPWEEQLSSWPICTVDVRVLRDGAGNSPTLIRQKIAEAITHLQAGRRVVICCDHGISRSNAIAAAVLAEERRVTLGEGLRHVIQVTAETRIKIDLVADLRKALDDGGDVASGRKVFVLGANGFIGRAITRILGTSAVAAGPDNDLALIDNPVLLDATLSEVAANRVLFCWHPPRLDTNCAIGQLICYLRNVLEVCRVRQAGLVFLSGHQIFAGCGEGRLVSCSEDHRPVPAGAAGDGLFLAETLVKQYESRHGLPMLIIRPSHVYGPGDDRKGFLNTFVRKALANQEIVTHRFQNGSPVVDLLHVNDLASAIKRAVEQQLTGILHIGSGDLISTSDLAGRIVLAAGSTSTISSVEMPGTCSFTQIEASFARVELDWRPLIELEKGLSELISCYITTPLEENKHYEIS